MNDDTESENDLFPERATQKGSWPKYKNADQAFEALIAKATDEPEPDFELDELGDDRETYRDAEHAARRVSERRDERAEAAKQDAEDHKRLEARAAAEMTNLATTGKAHADAIQATAPQYQQELARFNAAVQHASRMTDPTQKAEAAKLLEQERARLEDRGRQIYESGRAHGYAKMVQARPALADPKTRQDLAKTLLEAGYSEQQINNASADQIVSAYDQLSKQRAEVRKGREAEQERKRVAEAKSRIRAPYARLGSNPRSSRQAASDLRESGSMVDALNVLALRRQERREGVKND